MAIGIADEHVQLAAVASSFMKRHGERASARVALEAEAEELPEFWDDLRELGWLGLHLPEEYGGSGYGLEELAVVVEQLGRAIAAGPYVPCVIAGAVIAGAGSDELKQRLLPGLADGSLLAGVAARQSARGARRKREWARSRRSSAADWRGCSCWPPVTTW